MPEMPIGQLIRLYRINRKMTMAQVATHAGISARYLEMIEANLKTPSVPTLRRIAQVLRVRTSALLGDAPSEESADPAARRLDAVERALFSYGLPHDTAAEPPGLAALAARVDAARTAWFLSPTKFTDVLAVLPELIVDVEYAVRAYGRALESCRIATEVYRIALPVCKHAGRTDLSGLLADRAMRYAEESGDPVTTAAASWEVGHALLLGDMPEGALDIAMRAAERLKPLLSEGTSEVFSVYGGLLLCAVLAHVRAGQPWRGRQLLRGPASEVAKRVGDGKNHYGMVFGPANVAIHAAALEAEAGEISEAIRLADQVDITTVASLARRTTHLYTIARCYDQRNNDAAVLVHLQMAYRQCPQDFQYKREPQRLLASLIRRARPSFATEVRDFAAKVGVVPE